MSDRSKQVGDEAKNEKCLQHSKGSYEAVVESLRSAIANGEMLPNEHLVEVDLANEYGVSRAAVRSALLELAKEGLVERKRNRGARVRKITLEEAIEITEVRMVNEGLCAFKVAERATKAEVEELAEIINDMKQTLEAGDLMDYTRLNQLFHLRIREFSRHAKAAATVEGLRNQIVHYKFRLALIPGRPSVSLREHGAIVDAIANGDPGGAQEAMHVHLRSVIESLQGQSQQLENETEVSRVRSEEEGG